MSAKFSTIAQKFKINFEIEYINCFIDKYGDLIFDSHKKNLLQIKEWLRMLQEIKCKNNVYGFHWENCLWYDDKTTVGPDTCSCQNYRRYIDESKSIIQKYELLFERMHKKFVNGLVA